MIKLDKSDFVLAKKHTTDVSPGHALKILRELSELSQHELSRKSGVSQGHISDMEREVKKVSNNIAEKICIILNVPIEIIFGETKCHMKNTQA